MSVQCSGQGRSLVAFPVPVSATRDRTAAGSRRNADATAGPRSERHSRSPAGGDSLALPRQGRHLFRDCLPAREARAQLAHRVSYRVSGRSRCRRVQQSCAAVVRGDVAQGSGASRLVDPGRCEAPPLPHRVLARASALPVLRGEAACDEAPRIHARRPGRSNVAAPPCPAMPSRHARCPTRPNAIAKRDGCVFPGTGTAADQAEPAMFETRQCSS